MRAAGHVDRAGLPSAEIPSKNLYIAARDLENFRMCEMVHTLGGIEVLNCGNAAVLSSTEQQAAQRTFQGILFTNPRLGTSITWDFSDAQHPKRIPLGN